MEKSHVGMENKICPVCGKQHDFGCGVLLDRRLRQSLDRVNVTGYGMCEEHDRLWKDGFIAIVVFDPEKSKVVSGDRVQIEDAHRTGEIIHIKAGVFQMLFDMPKVEPIVFMDNPSAQQLKGQLMKMMEAGNEMH